MTTRNERIAGALERRLGHVRCAIEAVHHRHNVSAVLRTCDALGVHDVHLVQGDQRPARAPAKGAERWLGLHHHLTAAEGIAALRAHGYAIWVADFAEPPTPPEAVPIDRPVCLWFGAELVGVSAAARAAADGVVTVPMRGFAQSLNISVAAALVLHTVCERVRREVADPRLPEEARRDILAAWMAREEELRFGVTARAKLTLD